MNVDEIKINDYVRTDDGLLFKADEYWYYECLPKLDENVRNRLKAKPNIIELVEVGDYVNGERVENVFRDGLIYYDKFRIQTTEYNDYFEEDIRTIVTKEQFDSIKYEVK